MTVDSLKNQAVKTDKEKKHIKTYSLHEIQTNFNINLEIFNHIKPQIYLDAIRGKGEHVFF